MEKEGRTTGLEWGGPGRVGGAPGSQASPEAAAPGRCARPCLGLWGVFPGTPGTAASAVPPVPRWSKAGGLRPRRHPEVGAQVETRRFGTLGLEGSLAWGKGGQ